RSEERGAGRRAHDLGRRCGARAEDDVRDPGPLRGCRARAVWVAAEAAADSARPESRCELCDQGFLRRAYLRRACRVMTPAGSEKPKPPGAAAVVGVSISALAAATFAISAIGVLAPKLQSAFGLSRTGVGLLTSLMFLGAAIGSGPAGKLTDRRRPA